MADQSAAPQPKTWQQKREMLWDVFNIGRLKRAADMNFRLLQKHQDGTIGQQTDGSDPMPNGDISVGDQYHYHTAPPAAPQTSGLGTLARLAGVAALAAGTGGLGALAAPAFLALTQKPTPPAVQPSSPDDLLAPGINLKLFRRRN